MKEVEKNEKRKLIVTIQRKENGKYLIIVLASVAADAFVEIYYLLILPPFLDYSFN